MDSPTQLAKAGIPISICTDHPEIPQDLLAVSAGLCVREGLPWQTAMEAITWVPAVQAGIEDRWEVSLRDWMQTWCCSIPIHSLWKPVRPW